MNRIAHIFERQWQSIMRHTAFHEAGHAVASWVLQRELGRHWPQFHRIFLRTRAEVDAGPYVDDRGREEECLGMMEGPSRYNPHGGSAHHFAGGNAEILELWRQSMEANVVELLAGPIAEARHRHMSRIAIFLSGGAGDYERARLIAGEFARDDSERSAILNSCLARAVAIIRSPDHWRAVIAMAEALLARTSLDGDEATDIIAKAISRNGAVVR